MKIGKQLACGVLAVACAVGFIGCGSKDKDSSKKESTVDVSKLDASRPKVADGFFLAAMVRAPESTPLKALCEKHGLTVSDLLKKIPDQAQSNVQMLGLDKATYNWGSVSLGSEFGEDKTPDFAVAIAANLDLDKLIADLQKLDQGEPEKTECKKTTIAGVPAYEISDKNAPKVCVASLDGKLILVGSSSSILEKQLFLYCGGAGENSDFASFGQDGNVVVCVKASKVGANLKKMLPPSAFEKIGSELPIPGGKELVEGLGAVEVTFAASGDGKDIKLDMSVGTATVADSYTLASLAKNGLEMHKMDLEMKARNDADAKVVYNLLQVAKVETKADANDKVAKLSVTAPAELIFDIIRNKVNELR